MMAATAAWEGTGHPPKDEPQTPPGHSAQSPQGASASTSSTLLHDSAQSTAKDSPATSKKDSRSTVRVTVNLPVSTPTGTKLAVTTRSESPAGGEGLKVEPKSVDQEKEIALSQLQELEEAIKVRKVTKVDGRKIRWIEYRARKKQEEQEKATEAKKKGRRSKSVENSENDSSIVNNNNNNNKSDSSMKVEVVSAPLSVVGRSNVLESMKQQFLQGTENVGEPIANGKTDNQTETVEANQKRKSGRTRKSLNNQKGVSPKGNTPKNATPKSLTLKESNGKGVNRRSATPKGVAAKGGQKGSASTPDSSAASSPVLVSTPSTTSPPVTPVATDQTLSSSLKKPFFPARSLTKGLREVRKVENGDSPKKADEHTPIPASSPITPMSIATSTPILTQPKTEPGTKCPLIAIAARLLSPPTVRSKSLENAKGKKAGVRGGKKPNTKGAERSESEPRSILNGHTLVQNGPSEEEESISLNISSSDVDEKNIEFVEETDEYLLYESSEKTGPDDKALETSLDKPIKEEEIEPKLSDTTAESDLSIVENTLEMDIPSRRGRGRPPKRKFGAAAKDADSSSAGKSGKKLSTVVADVHNTMNGEPQTIIATPKSGARGKKASPTKKFAKVVVLPEDTDVSDTKDSLPTHKHQTESSDRNESDLDSREHELAGSEAKKSNSNAGKKHATSVAASEERDDTSASMSNQTPLLNDNTQSTKLVKGVQKLVSEEVPTETEVISPSIESELEEAIRESQEMAMKEQSELDELDGKLETEELLGRIGTDLESEYNFEQELQSETVKKVSKTQMKKGQDNELSVKSSIEEKTTGKSKKVVKTQGKKGSPFQKGMTVPKGPGSPSKKKETSSNKKIKTPAPHPRTPKVKLMKDSETSLGESPLLKKGWDELDDKVGEQEVAGEDGSLPVNTKDVTEIVQENYLQDKANQKSSELQGLGASQVNNLPEVVCISDGNKKELKDISYEKDHLGEEKDNNNLPKKQTEVQILSDEKPTEDTGVKAQENSQELVVDQGENILLDQTQDSSIIPKQNGNVSSEDVGVSPSTTSISPETSASGGKSKEKVPRILKQLLQDEGVQNMLKSMGEESITAPEGSPSESSVHKLRPKRASEPMLSSSPELDVLEALLSPTTKKKKQRSELDTLYMDEGVLNLLTSLDPTSRRQQHQDDAASDISQASSAKSVKVTKSSKSVAEGQLEGRKRKLSGASTVSNTSTRSMQPPDSKKPRLESQENPPEDPYELDAAEEFKEPSENLESGSTEQVLSQPVRKRGRPTLPLSVKQKNKAIRMQLKLQKQKQQKVNTVVGALLKEDDNMNLAQLKDVLKRASKAFNQPYGDDARVETPTGKAVPPLKIKLPSDSVTIKQIARPASAQGQQTMTSPAGEGTETHTIKPSPKQISADVSFNRPIAKTTTEAKISPKSSAEKAKIYPERRTPPPQHRRLENITSPTAASFSSLVKTLEATGQQKSRQRTGGESLRQSQRASVRQSEGSYHYRDISLRKFNNFTQIILSPSTTKMKNALNSRVLRELCEALNILKRDDAVRMVLLTATGSTFCQGVDLTALQHPNLETRKKNAENLVRGIKDFLKALVQFPKPIVAGVNGNAMGLGVTMLPLFDMVIANDKAEFYLPYAKLGQVPEGGATYTFPNLFGKLQSTRLFLGHKLTAAKAQEMGLASESIWPATYQQELIPKVALLASQSAQSMEATKALMNHHLVTKLELSLESECRLLLQQWTSPHFAHHCKRFLDSHHVQLQKPVNLPL